MKKVISIFFVVAVPFLFWSWQSQQQIKHDYLSLYMLDIGQGDSFLIRTPEGHTLLIDGGPDASLVQQLGQVLPWWQREIDSIMFTHADLDHFGGFISLLEQYKVHEVWFNGDYDTTNKQYLRLLEKIKQLDITPKKISQGTRIELDSDVTLDILWPDSSGEIGSNDRSLITRLSYGQMNALLTGDASSVIEDRLVGSNVNIEAEILKVGHHGSRYSTDSKFLQIVRPEICLISAGQKNRYGHPHPEVLKRLRDYDCATFITATQGPVELRLRPQSISLSATLPAWPDSGILNPK